MNPFNERILLGASIYEMATKTGHCGYTFANNVNHNIYNIRIFWHGCQSSCNAKTD